MKAAVILSPGCPESFAIEELPIPTPAVGEVLVRVRAFGLNRSELFTRQGHSPNVQFPRVLGIEAVGEVVDAPGNEFVKGAVVATYFRRTPLESIAEQVINHEPKIQVGKVFYGLENIVKAHELMDSNQAGGNTVLLP
ncbi:hypothetical protein LTS08_005072 [Lithohypha guttulata]|nr:hypothetical protein LTS08_005072 [Lithohypha guttulata]